MLNKHFREFIELLEKHKVRYLLVGGYAVGYHGFPRYTGGLDVFIGISHKNSERIMEVFSEFGFSDLGIGPNDLMEEEIVVEIGREPLKIQILTGIDGVNFEECYKNKVLFDAGNGLSIPFIAFKDLLKNKSASPRAKDKIDFAELKRIRGNIKTD